MPEEVVPATAIDAAPDESPAEVSGIGGVSQYAILDAYNRLQTAYEQVVAELQRVRGSAEAERARLVRPYAWAVFCFLCAYCSVVFLLIAFDAGRPLGFHVSPVVLTTAVGSTAAAAIWLVRIIVQGLFPGAAEGGAES